MAWLLPLSLALAISAHTSEPGAMQQWPHHGDPHRRRARHRIKGELSFAKAMSYRFHWAFSCFSSMRSMFARVFGNKKEVEESRKWKCITSHGVTISTSCPAKSGFWLVRWGWDSSTLFARAGNCWGLLLREAIWYCWWKTSNSSWYAPQLQDSIRHQYKHRIWIVFWSPGPLDSVPYFQQKLILRTFRFCPDSTHQKLHRI